MFNNAKLQARISELEWKLKYEQDRVERYKRWYEEMRDKEAHKEEMKRAQLKAREASIYIDFDKIDVFSIERRVNEWAVANTEIAYWKEELEDGQIVKKYKTLVYHCSDEIHEALVDDYENWKSFQ